MVELGLGQQSTSLKLDWIGGVLLYLLVLAEFDSVLMNSFSFISLFSILDWWCPLNVWWNAWIRLDFLDEYEIVEFKVWLLYLAD